MTLTFLLRDLLRSDIDSPALLGEIDLRAPRKCGRVKGVLAVLFARTTQVLHAPLLTMIREYDALTEVRPELDIFHGSRAQYGDLMMEALELLYAR